MMLILTCSLENTLQTAPKIFGGQITSHLLAFTSGDAEEILKGLREAAKEFKGRVSARSCSYNNDLMCRHLNNREFSSLFLQILFVQIDMDDDSSSRVAEFFNVVKEDAPTTRLINMDQDIKKFVPEFEGLGSEDIKKFVNDYLEGNLKVIFAPLPILSLLLILIFLFRSI